MSRSRKTLNIKSKSSKGGSVRIIAGQWRGRKLDVLGIDGLRPTPDRIRETVFNWLMHDLAGAQCLDLCAGTGALGFEALSRGARSVEMVDASNEVCEKLRENVLRLEAQGDVQIIRSDAMSYLKTLPSDPRFDLVFIDPPYALANHTELMAMLEQSNSLNPDALIYIEFPNQQREAISSPVQWRVVKSKTIGNVQFCLYLREQVA